MNLPPAHHDPQVYSTNPPDLHYAAPPNPHREKPHGVPGFQVKGRGRTGNEWKPCPGAPDNHWLDCLVGAAVAASTLGVSLEGTAAVRRQKTNKRKRKNVSYL